jgi:aminomethyltransferase
MGQCFLRASDHETVAATIERLVPADIRNLAPSQQRYSQLLADDGGILDDLMITRWSDEATDGVLYVVVNAGCKLQDHAHFRRHLPATVEFTVRDDLALLALQGHSAAAALENLAPTVSGLAFMQSGLFDLGGIKAHVSRSGYTGEDGFEISVGADAVTELWNKLRANPEVKPIGLGARDSLRLEAGLCLYGHDIDVTTSPVEAQLQWSIQKSRRIGGGFPGAARIQQELAEGPSCKRVGVRPEGRAIAREGTIILNADGAEIGKVTSGGFGPTVNGPIAMGYVTAAHAGVGTAVQLAVRDKLLAATVVSLPFVPNNFKR